MTTGLRVGSQPTRSSSPRPHHRALTGCAVDRPEASPHRPDAPILLDYGNSEEPCWSRKTRCEDLYYSILRVDCQTVCSFGRPILDIFNRAASRFNRMKCSRSLPTGVKWAWLRPSGVTTCYCTGTNSTRRFCARPSGVSLEATKFVFPNPWGINRLAETPCRAR